jgi:subtilase family serine protease
MGWSSIGRRAGALAAPVLLSAFTFGAAAPAVAAVATGHMTPAVGVQPHFRSAGAPVARGSSVLFGCQEAGTDFPCYGPSQMQHAYGTDSLYPKGINGTGKTIVIIDAFQNPYINEELADFDAQWGLPAINLQIVAPDGLTPFDVTDGNMVGWSGEISLDVQYSHAIAPKAKVVLVLAKSNNDADMVSAERYAIQHNLGDVVSMSYGEGEKCFDPKLAQQEYLLFAQASLKGITLIASSGDDGAAQPGCNSGDPDFLSASTPASNPFVLGVGGTNLTADLTTGQWQSEVAWDDGYGQSGGGFSVRYPKPIYQIGVTPTLARAVPDVAYNAGVFDGVLVNWYVPFEPGAGEGAVWIFGGTSAGSPQWAGITSLLDQSTHGRAGVLNDNIYRILRDPKTYKADFHDITSGNNVVPGVGGYNTAKGWDPVTGVGTPIVPSLLKDLAHH